ncbi:Glutaminase [Synechococcus sp. CBW1107]|nr:Glutaminase [Synechococcus sp. CBW1107]
MRPFNPCVTAGAIMTAGIVASGWPDRSAREITQEIMNLWSDLCGGLATVRFSEETMLSERKTAHNNFAIAYLLQGRKGLPRNVDLHKMLDLYLSCCSIEMTANMLPPSGWPVPMARSKPKKTTNSVHSQKRWGSAPGCWNWKSEGSSARLPSTACRRSRDLLKPIEKDMVRD